MKALDEILDLAIESPESLPEVMMYCRVAGVRLGNEPLQRWSAQELAGYLSPSETPQYRFVRGSLRGNFGRYFEPPMPDAIPATVLGPELRQLLEIVPLSASVGVLSQMQDDGSVFFPVPLQRDILSLINQQFGTAGRFHDLWVQVPPGSIRHVLMEIRQRAVTVLSELIAVSSVVNNANDEMTTLDQSGEITQAINQILNVGTVGTLVYRSAGVSVDNSIHTIQQINVGDWDSLDSYLERQLVRVEERVKLQELLQSESEPSSADESGRDIQEWVERVSDRLSDGAAEVLKESTKKTMTNVLTAAIKSYAPTVGRWAWVAVLDISQRLTSGS
jgi:hypothetical protein